MRKKLFRRLLVGALVLGLLGAAATAAMLALGWREQQRPFSSSPAPQQVTLEFRSGLSAAAILEELEQAGVLASAWRTRLYLTRALGDPPLRAGEYRFHKPFVPHRVLDRLIRGDVVLHQVTLIEGQTLTETAEHLADRGFGDLDEFLRLFRDPTPILDLDSDADTLEGYLFPETYSFAKGAPEKAILRKLIATFRESFELEIRPLLAAETTVRELVTLASIVEKEAQLDEERATIAAVYLNRLRIGMGLFADPTVIYALQLAGRWDGNIRRSDLQIDSPYNTYRVAGLPPGPICSPGLASMVAAARPAEAPYLYFVSRNDGSHVFARTLSEHNSNVERWQRQYWRDRWRREGR